MNRRASFLLGQPQVVDALASATAQQRLAHGLLFVGPDGVGRERAARGLAAGLLCEAEQQDLRLPFGCGQCRGCRRVESRHHPDVHHLLPDAEAVARGWSTPEKRVASREIRVEQVRELAHAMRLKPYEGRARVAIVTDAHRMNTRAQNALLKTLEEPGPASLLVLIAPHSRSVLPTIESRCQRIRFRPLTGDVVRTIAERIGEVEALAGVDSAALESMTDLLGDGENQVSERAAAQEFLDEMVEATAPDRLDLVERVGRDRATVDGMLQLAHGIAITKVRDAAMRGDDAVDGRAFDALLHVAHAIAETRKMLARNAHVQIALEDLALRVCAPPR